jgi:hypothetical protein
VKQNEFNEFDLQIFCSLGSINMFHWVIYFQQVIKVNGNSMNTHPKKNKTSKFPDSFSDEKYLHDIHNKNLTVLDELIKL